MYIKNIILGKVSGVCKDFKSCAVKNSYLFTLKLSNTNILISFGESILYLTISRILKRNRK